MNDRLSETVTVRLLDAWKAKKGIDSDYAAAKELKVSRGTPANWRHLRSHAKPSLAARMAKDLGIDELPVLAAIEADRTHDGDDRRVWQKHGRALFAALVVGIAVTGPVQASQLRPLQTQQIGSHDPLCEILEGGDCGSRPVGLDVAQILPPCQVPLQGRTGSMTKLDTYQRTELVADLQHRPGMAVDDGCGETWCCRSRKSWETLAAQGFQRDLSARGNPAPC